MHIHVGLPQPKIHLSSLLSLGDTYLTKVFVGGLAWETPKKAMRQHFQKYGEILEAVIISGKLTGRYKGYRFVNTFKDADSAKKACADATSTINDRRANCNLTALGTRHPRSSSAAVTAAANPLPQQGVNVGPSARASTPPPPNHVQWYIRLGHQRRLVRLFTPTTTTTIKLFRSMDTLLHTLQQLICFTIMFNLSFSMPLFLMPLVGLVILFQFELDALE
ncbi:hypothetical protein ACS0TY_003098 [Phlomoides rotata]